MEETITLDGKPRADADYESAIDQYLDKMEHIAIQMAEKQRRIERLQAETQEALARLKAA